jgi:hypothetical protein
MPSRRARFFASTLFAIVAISSVAFAGKHERDKQKALASNIASAKADLKSRCGCTVAVDVKWDSYSKVGDMSSIASGLKDLVEATQDNCDDDNEKKVLCSHLKTFAVTHDKQAKVSYDTGTLTCGTADSIHCGPEQLNKIVDSW